MLTFNSLEQNHGFLILETRAQFADAVRFLGEGTPELENRLAMRNELIRNMKNTMEHDCFRHLFATPGLPAGEVQKVRSMHRIALACRRIANHCRNMCLQAGHMGDTNHLGEFSWREMAATATACLERIPKHFDQLDEDGARFICRGEETLDTLYDTVIDAVSEAARRAPDNFRELLAVIFIARYMEGVGDELLRIGEALLSARIGERIQYHEYESLRRGLARMGGDDGQDGMRYQAFWGSRSGCVIGRVTGRDRRCIFKEGPVEKVRREKDNMLEWNRAVPGIVPDVLDYSEENGLGALLMEEIQGVPMDEILLGEDASLLLRARTALTRTFRQAWDRTFSPEPAATGSMAQVLDRLDKIRQIHPDLGAPEGVAEAGLTRIRRALELERGIRPVFSVRIHGDCNLNNIFYNAHTDTVRFVDLYRSRRGDYVQDIAVHLVSYFRTPVFDPKTRGRILENILAVETFANAFGAAHQDGTMQIRLTLALARSLLTSTRFELRSSLAAAMFARAYAMLDAVLTHGEAPWEDFRAPLHLLDFNPQAQSAA